MSIDPSVAPLQLTSLWVSVTVGFWLTVKLTVSAAEQPDPSLQVSTICATPGPVKLAVVAHWAGSNVTVGPESWLHPQLPVEQLPLRLKVFGPDAAAHWD